MGKPLVKIGHVAQLVEASPSLLPYPSLPMLLSPFVPFFDEELRLTLSPPFLFLLSLAESHTLSPSLSLSLSCFLSLSFSLDLPFSLLVDQMTRAKSTAAATQGPEMVGHSSSVVQSSSLIAMDCAWEAAAKCRYLATPTAGSWSQQTHLNLLC